MAVLELLIVFSNNSPNPNIFYVFIFYSAVSFGVLSLLSLIIQMNNSDQKLSLMIKHSENTIRGEAFLCHRKP